MNYPFRLSRFQFVVGIAMLVCALVGLVALMIPSSTRELWGDGYFFHYSANLIADGKGWINPLHYRVNGTVIQAADHPPFYLAYLAVFSFVGLDSIGAHQFATVLLCVAAVPLFALIGRRLGGNATGMVAAFIGALHPAIWGWNRMIMSEPSAIFSVCLLILVALEFRDRKLASKNLIWVSLGFGFCIGLAALARAELLLLGVLLAAVSMIDKHIWHSLKSLTISGIAALITISPWVIFNLSRFDETVLLSNGAQITLAATNCDETYGGQFQAFWVIDCSNRALEIAKQRNPGADQSQITADIGQQAWDYISSHKATAVKTAFLRMGRVLGVYRPLQQINFDHFPEGREKYVAISAWMTYYMLLPFVIAGAYLLRHKDRVLPLLLMPVLVALFTCAITFGNTRYRVSAEPAMIVFASIALTASATRIKNWWLDGKPSIERTM